jgi:hypothetical protein
LHAGILFQALNNLVVSVATLLSIAISLERRHPNVYRVCLMDFCHIFQAEAVLTANYAECLQRLAERSLIFFTIGCQSQGTFKGVKTTNTTQVLPY